jgi:tyrosyl-tRNA synthetase
MSTLRRATPEEQFAELTRAAVDVHVAEELKARLKKSYDTEKPLVVKAGFDPTAPDLHLGHTVLLARMRRFQDFGHTVVFVIGDFTGMIGDPTGKNATRPPLSPEDIARNAETYRQQVFKVLDAATTQVRFNNEWLGKLSSRDVIYLAAKYPVARMLERDDFKRRFKEGRTISIHEFLYPLMQGYDSVALKCDVELGGSDQLFNLLVGRDLMRDYGLIPQMVVTGPLLEGLDARWEGGKLVGDKMSKTSNNYVGISEPPLTIFSKLMSVSDELMWRYYALLSSKSSTEIASLKRDVHPMEAKKLFAAEMVTRFVSAKEAVEARAEWERVHTRGDLPTEIETKALRAPEGKIGVLKAMTDTGLSESNGEARRLIVQGGVTIDGNRVSDTKLELNRGDYVFKVGKKRFLKVHVE